ncbi:class I mannose-6-phosphate isomerase [Weissella diestrammenae]|uniref:Mannose-6-phosphate isomerase n=1 Tax=Weissella diestrammenae TaxID=1162633 RepID=A0A7G9T712_9LACO|nr:type I phosphomannose isomerase catalytic subunit [Weissella diestrammenae]MCM0582516.1 class I mannose-6-phosphate isomerase [Weissella diestrammenae]QNN75887.1 class I mannose-6-phosphate isomerase [Weissella diestrammenae]
MTEPIFLTPVLHEKIWGGTALKDVFKMPIPSATTGEAWIISGHPNGVSPVANDKYAGQTLAQLWQNRPDLFENKDATRPYPLLVKFLDAHRDLSVQVHPDDTYAAAHHASELGKTESWYILAAEPGAEIYYGHQAKTKSEFDTLVDQGAWDKLLQKVPVKAGDFFYVPAGTLHALGAGVLALETQQSSDVTYRVYDFDRPDPKTGELRQLHLADAKNVTTVPFVPEKPIAETLQLGALTKTTLVEAPYFNVYQDVIAGEAFMTKQAPYTQYTVIAGSGTVTVNEQVYPLALATSFIMPATVAEWQFSGDMTLIVSTPGPKSR